MRRFLFLQYEVGLGTAVIATATLQALRTAIPDAHVTVAASGAPANLLRASPLVDDVIRTPDPVKNFPAALFFFLRHVWPRRHAFDCVICDNGNRRGKIAALAMASGIPIRAGHSERPRLLNRPARRNPHRSNLDNNLEVLRTLGIPVQHAAPVMHFSPADLAHAETLFDAQARGPRITMVTQTSGGEPNDWFEDRFIALSRALIEQKNAQIYFAGTGGEAAAIDRMREAIGLPTFSIAGKTDLPQLAAFMSQCDLVISPDTGGMHMAVATGTPTVVLANAHLPRHVWLPNFAQHAEILLHDDVPCAFCALSHCETRECMQEIEVPDVVAAAARVLERYPPGRAGHQARAAAHLNTAA